MDAGRQDAGEFWSSFARDPRRPENQSLRAADRDRDLVVGAIGEAFADGRLTREEMDDRLSQVQGTRMLGDLLPIVTDLMPTEEVASRTALAQAGEDEIERLALLRYRERRRQALAAMLVPSLICLTIWVWSMVSSGELIFPWPIFVILGTGGYLSRLVFGKESAIEEERERLRKKRAKALGGERDESPALTDGEPEENGDPDQERRRDHWR
jgi:Domain of unknown function (DUF1707)